MDQKLVIGAVIVVIIIVAAVAYVATGSRSAPAQQATTVQSTVAQASTTAAVSNVTTTNSTNSTMTNSTMAANTTTGYSINVWSNSTINGDLYLTNMSGRTLYLFTQDTPSSGNSTCYGSCATIWPPFYAGANATFAPSINSSQIGTITRTGGAMQTTYQGWPLYFYAGDSASGQVKGQGVGGTWYVVSPLAQQQVHH